MSCIFVDRAMSNSSSVGSGTQKLDLKVPWRNGVLIFMCGQFFFSGAYVSGGLAILEDSGPKIGFFKHGLRGFILWFDWFGGEYLWYLGLDR